MTRAPGIEGSAGPLSPEYLTLDEFAALLRVKSTRTIRRLVRRDPTVPMLKLGRQVLFPRERVLRWLQSREQGPGRPKRTRTPLPSRAQVRVVPTPGQPGRPPCADLCADETPEAAGKSA